MSSRGARRVWVGLTLAWLTACRGDGTSAGARERVLARIPGDVTTVLAAESHALSHAHVRAVIDVLRPHWPARMGCAIDAMLAGDQVAVGIGPRGTTVVIETPVAVECPALSNLGGRLWVATLGAGSVARETSVLDDPRRARAKPYLLAAPIAAAIDLSEGTALATARPDPLEAWLALDSTPELAPVAEARVTDYLREIAGRPVTGPFAQKIAVTRSGSQVVATLQGPVDADLSVALRLVLEDLDAPELAEDDAWPCPPAVSPVRQCEKGPVFHVSTIEETVAPILEVTLVPVIVNTRAHGLRLQSAVPALGLVEGDVIVGAGGQPVIDRIQLSGILRRARSRISLIIERGGRTTTLSLVEPDGI